MLLCLDTFLEGTKSDERWPLASYVCVRRSHCTSHRSKTSSGLARIPLKVMVFIKESKVQFRWTWPVIRLIIHFYYPGRHRSAEGSSTGSKIDNRRRRKENVQGR